MNNNKNKKSCHGAPKSCPRAILRGPAAPKEPPKRGPRPEFNRKGGGVGGILDPMDSGGGLKIITDVRPKTQVNCQFLLGVVSIQNVGICLHLCLHVKLILV